MKTEYRLRRGMVVRSRDGDKLGKTVAITEADRFVVEKGHFFPEEFTASQDDIFTVLEGEIFLKKNLAELRAEGAISPDVLHGVLHATRRHKPPHPQPHTQHTQNRDQEITLPVIEEELIARKHFSEKDRVRIIKSVKHEEKQITVSLRREELRIERIPVSESSDAVRPSSESHGAFTSPAKPFSGETLIVPLYEEQVEILKHPVVREEIHISKAIRLEDQEFSREVRKQDVAVERLNSRNSGRKAG